MEKRSLIIGKHFLRSKKVDDISTIIKKLNLNNSKHLLYLSEIIHYLAQIAIETEELISRRTKNWLTEDITDLEGFLGCLISHPSFKKDPNLKSLERQLKDLAKLRNSIKSIK